MTLENEQFTSEQIKLPEFLERRTVHDLTPGGTGYLDAEAFIIRGDYTCWLDGLAEIKTEQEFGAEYVRVVCFDTGVVIDIASNYHKRTSFFREGCGPMANEAKKMMQYEYDETMLLPVIGIVVSETDLLKLDAAYKELTGVHYLGKKARKLVKTDVETSKQGKNVTIQKQATE